jgi:hypothetical protein
LEQAALGSVIIALHKAEALTRFVLAGVIAPELQDTFAGNNLKPSFVPLVAYESAVDSNRLSFRFTAGGKGRFMGSK